VRDGRHLCGHAHEQMRNGCHQTATRPATRATTGYR
jgi:hypothetical protein